VLSPLCDIRTLDDAIRSCRGRLHERPLRRHGEGQRDRQTDTHKTSGCCSGSSEMLREKSTAAGVRNNSGRAVQRHFLRSGCGCHVCAAERNCLLRGTSCVFKYNSCNFVFFPLKVRSFPFLLAKLFPTFLIRQCAIFIQVFSQVFWWFEKHHKGSERTMPDQLPVSVLITLIASVYCWVSG